MLYIYEYNDICQTVNLATTESELAVQFFSDGGGSAIRAANPGMCGLTAAMAVLGYAQIRAYCAQSVQLFETTRFRETPYRFVNLGYLGGAKNVFTVGGYSVH